MENFVFQNSTKILFGKGQFGQIAEQAATLGGRILLVTGQGSVKKSGLLDRALAKLNEQGLEVVQLNGIEANPQIGSVRLGGRLCRENDIDGIVALGGGSVIDASKAISAAAGYDGDLWDIITKKEKATRFLPLGVVLTLAATGSEANGNTVISNPELGEKRAVYYPQLYPKFAILDPELTYGVPADQTAYGSVDIMSHVLEQYFHDIENSDIPDGIAETIMRTVIRYAPVAMEKPDDYDARANLMWASTMALNGIVGSGVKGDWTCHIMSHELTAKYGLAHGAALAVVYNGWMNKVVDRKAKRFAQYARKVWGVHPNDARGDIDMAREGVDKTMQFYRGMGVGVTLSDYEIDDARLEEMADAVVAQKGVENLGGLTRDDLVEIFRSVL